MNFRVGTERPDPAELAMLFSAVGWGEPSAESLQRSVAAYPCVACARLETGMLAGYVSAFSDGVLSTMLGELIVHPEQRRRGIGAKLLQVVEMAYPNAPIYIKALGESKSFYLAQGFIRPAAEMTVMFKHSSKGSGRAA